MPELDASGIPIAIVGGQLALVVIDNTIVRKTKCIQCFFRTFCKRGFDLGGRDRHVDLAKIQAIELQGKIDEGGVSARTNIAEHITARL